MPSSKFIAVTLAVLASACGAPASNAASTTPESAAATPASAAATPEGAGPSVAVESVKAPTTEAPPAADFNLAERDHFTRIQPTLDQYGKSITGSCFEEHGKVPGAILFELDKATWKGHVVVDKARSAADNDDTLQGVNLTKCQGAEYSIRRACGSPEGKKAVQAKIKKVVCSYTASPEPTIGLSDGVLSVGVNALKSRGNSDIEVLTKTFLGKNL
jgi:hypothetical protein